MRAALVRSLAPVLLILAVLAPAPLAQAHDSLVSSTPESGQVLSAAPSQVSLTFSAAISEEFAQVAVVDAAGTTYQDGSPAVAGAVVTQAVRPLPPGSDVTVSYRVVSSDGHPVGGTVVFTVAAGAQPEPTTAVAPDEDPAVDPEGAGAGASGAGADAGASGASAPDQSAQDDQASQQDQTEQTVATEPDSSAGPGLWLAALAAVAVLVALGVVLARRRTRTPSSV